MHIVYVEDDLKIQAQTSKLLRREGHEVTAFADVPHALSFLRTTQPALLLCDYRLEGSLNGLALAKQARLLYPACPIVMISSYTTTDNVIDALELDVDAYVKRPISFPDLLNKLYEAVARRRHKQASGSPRLSSGALVLDISRRVATCHGESLDLTPTEFGILAQLVSKPGHVFTMVDLCAAVKGVRLECEQARQLLKPHICALRAKLSREGLCPPPIRNVRGQGYQWLTTD